MTVLQKENIFNGNPKSKVGICCLWSRKELYKFIDPKEYHFLGNLYSYEGINILLRNIFLNPVIKTIIITGPDLSGTGEALIHFFKKGVKKDHTIRGTNFSIQTNIPLSQLEKLRKHITIVDMRTKKPREVETRLKKVKGEAKPYMKAKFYPEVAVDVKTLPSERSGYLVHNTTIADAWLKFVDLVMKYGEIKKSQHHAKQKEILNIMMVTSAEDKSIPKWINFTKDDLEKYLPSILSNKKPPGVAYTYGSRIFGKVNQYEKAIAILKKDSFSRRAVINVWEKKDLNSDQPPCLTQITWNIQNKKLYQTVVFRSHDVYAGLPLNLYALFELQKMAAKELKVKTGLLTCVSESAHIYETDWKTAKELLNEHYIHNQAFKVFDQDPRGNFVITIAKDELLVQHYTPDSAKSSYFFKGKDINDIFHEMEEANLISSRKHAFYIGKELRKAYECMKSGKKYKQDYEHL